LHPQDVMMRQLKIEVFTDEKGWKCFCFCVKGNGKVLLENLLPEKKF
jgi:hypothetical protein